MAQPLNSVKSPRKSTKKPRLFLKRDEKISKGLRSVASLQIEAALWELKGNNVSPEPIHNARTYIKKVHSIVQLAAPALGRMRRESLMKQLQEASSRLAPLRDSEMQVQSLDLVIETAALPPEQFSSLRSGLADIAKQRRINDTRQIPLVMNFLRKVLKSIPEWPLDMLEGKGIRRRIRRTYRRGRTTLEVCQVSGNQALFHAWRKLVKQLGYQLQITAKFWPDSATDLIASVDRIGELAGRERDYSLLIQTMKQGPRTRSSEQLIAVMEELIPPLRKETLENGVLFYDLKPKFFIEPLDL